MTDKFSHIAGNGFVRTVDVSSKRIQIQESTRIKSPSELSQCRIGRSRVSMKISEDPL
jgi:polynucleotide 5'-kinase involved in rRNA processing